MQIARKSLAVVFQILLFSTTALAQSSVTGRVVDPQGGNVAGAEVTLSAGAQRVNRTRAAADGTFSIAGVAPGSYTLRIEAPGFQSSTQTITVGPGLQPLNVTLAIAAFTEDVAVVAPKLEEELPQEIEKAGTRMQT